MDARAKEYSWAVKLTEKDAKVKWGGTKDDALEQLVMKLAVLGSGAKDGERNLVEVTTFNSDQNKIKTCICALTRGLTENVSLNDMALFPPLHFTLLEGSGPVHVVATHLLLDDEDLTDDDDEDLSDFEEDEIEDAKAKFNAKKKPDAKGTKVPGKATKKEEEDDDDFEDLDEVDSEEEDEEEKSKAQKKKKMNSFAEVEAEEEDDDAIMEDDSEEEEEQEAPSKKRKLDNGKAAKAAQKNVTTPDRGGKKAPVDQKTPKSQKKENGQTPKSAKKTPAKPAFNTVEDVKAAIAKYPGGKPRKQDKFVNWVQHQFKVSDDSWKNSLWAWHKKELGL